MLEYIPYRKDDITAAQDESRMAWFAGHGYACLRVDLRGSGDSDGVSLDEYLEQEQDDAVEVIAWIAAQPWCTGAVGMIGISWGGFNGAAGGGAAAAGAAGRRSRVCRPTTATPTTCITSAAALLADEPARGRRRCSSTDACPPDPDVVGERWREMWLERLDGRGPWSSLAAPPASRRLLAARLDLRGLRRDRVPGAAPSAAGRTATATRCCGCSRRCDVPRRG